jgi:hypothetical protein
MVTVAEVLGTDFDGNPSDSVSEVLLDGLSDPRRAERVPALIEILHSSESADVDQFLSCIVLTSWAQPEGFSAVIEACRDPEGSGWRELSIDRMYSMDNTFGELAHAVRTSYWLVDETGTTTLRMAAIHALVDVADRVYLDGQLDSVISRACTPEIVRSVTAVVQRGLARLRDGDEPRWDLATQLVDVASGIAVQASAVAVELTIDLMTWSPHGRLLHHAAALLARADPATTTDLADLILAYGGDTIAPVVADARRQQQLGR